MEWASLWQPSLDKRKIMPGRNGGKRKQAVKNTGEWRTEAGTERATTYERSSGVAGCDPLRLCAKLRFPVPAWRGAFWSPAPPMDTPPPNAAHPEPLLAVMSVVSGSGQARAGPPPHTMLDVEPSLKGWHFRTFLLQFVLDKDGKFC